MILLETLTTQQREYVQRLVDGKCCDIGTAIDIALKTSFKRPGRVDGKAEGESNSVGDLLSGLIDTNAPPAIKPSIASAIAFNVPSDSETTASVSVRKTAPRRKVAAPEQQTLVGPAEVPAPAPAKAKKSGSEKIIRPVWDYRNDELPAKVRDLIEAHLEIESEDAKSAGTLGFMTRALAIATLPHRSTDDWRFVRRNGDFTLTMMTAHPEGLPYGTLPRLLLTWVATEVVQKREPVLFLGDTLAEYLQELGLHNSGGKRGDITRLKRSMTTLFSSIISCHYDGQDKWALQNVLLADKVEWWTPQQEDEAGSWHSRLQLSRPFFQECIDHPVPVDLRAMKVLQQSPLALDIYVWLTHRMSYLRKRTTIPWYSLTGQFGASYAQNDQGLRDFRRAFLRELKKVTAIYPEAKVSNSKNGLVLYPSPTHVLPASTPKQPSLPFLNDVKG